MTRVMYNVPSDPTITKVTVHADCFTEGAAPELTHDPERTQRPRLGRAALMAKNGGTGIPGSNVG